MILYLYYCAVLNLISLSQRVCSAVVLTLRQQASDVLHDEVFCVPKRLLGLSGLSTRYLAILAVVLRDPVEQRRGDLVWGFRYVHVLVGLLRLEQLLQILFVVVSLTNRRNLRFVQQVPVHLLHLLSTGALVRLVKVLVFIENDVGVFHDLVNIVQSERRKVGVSLRLLRLLYRLTLLRHVLVVVKNIRRRLLISP